MSEIYDLQGRKFSGSLKVKLRPGFGIVGPNGEHIEGGPHVLPLRIAQDLLETNRAFLWVEEVVERDPVVESRDPVSRGKKR